MSANFTPTLGTYTDLKPFRFWCQKVLPLVYDDSLSYYELLCKVVDYLNKTMEDVDTSIQDVAALHTAYDQLQDYINSEIENFEGTVNGSIQQLETYMNDYFSNLDVQTEINNKLDMMADDGTLDTLLLPYFNAYKIEINDMIMDQNRDLLTLSERMDTFTHLTEGSTTGDAELMDGRIGANGITYPNIGDAIRGQYTELRTDIDDIIERTGIESDLTALYNFVGTQPVIYNNGTLGSTGTAWNHSGYVDVSRYDRIVITLPQVVSANINGLAFYDADKTYISGLRMNYGSQYTEIGMTVRTVTVPAGAVYMRSTWFQPDTTYYSLYTFDCKGYIDGVPVIPDGLIDYDMLNSELKDAAFHPVINTIERGNITSGLDTSSSTRARTVGYIPVGKGSILRNNSNGAWRAGYAIYNAQNLSWDTTTDWSTSDATIAKDCYIRMLYSKPNGANITDEELAALPGIVSISYRPFTSAAGIVSTNTPIIPDYYYENDYLPDKIDAIRALEDDSSYNGDAFIFLTDYHLLSNYRKSPLLVQKIMTDTSIKRLVFGGDAITNYDTPDEAKAAIQDFRRDFYYADFDKWFPVFGNHELNDPGESHQERRLTAAAAYGTIIKEKELSVHVIDEYAYYVDNEAQKIRYLFISCTYQGQIPAATITAIYSMLESMPGTLALFVISHIALNSDGTMDRYFNTIAAAMDTLKTGGTITYSGQTYTFTIHTVIGCISGHSHVDNELDTSGGIPIITTACDAHLGNMTRTRNTVLEQCFDVVQIDMTNRAIYLTRIGAGSDRTYTY